jgi:hypothetical protein
MDMKYHKRANINQKSQSIWMYGVMQEGSALMLKAKIYTK